jgi:hypothetical protein
MVMTTNAIGMERKCKVIDEPLGLFRFRIPQIALNSDIDTLESVEEVMSLDVGGEKRGGGENIGL